MRYNLFYEFFLNRYYEGTYITLTVCELIRIVILNLVEKFRRKILSPQGFDKSKTEYINEK